MSAGELLEAAIAVEGYIIGATPFPSFLATTACLNPCVTLAVFNASAKNKYYFTENNPNATQKDISKTWRIYQTITEIYLKHCQ